MKLPSAARRFLLKHIDLPCHNFANSANFQLLHIFHKIKNSPKEHIARPMRGLCLMKTYSHRFRSHVRRTTPGYLLASLLSWWTATRNINGLAVSDTLDLWEFGRCSLGEGAILLEFDYAANISYTPLNQLFDKAKCKYAIISEQISNSPCGHKRVRCWKQGRGVDRGTWPVCASPFWTIARCCISSSLVGWTAWLHFRMLSGTLLGASV